MCAKTCSCVREQRVEAEVDEYVTVPCVCDMTHWICVPWLVHVCVSSVLRQTLMIKSRYPECVTWLLEYVCHDLFRCAWAACWGRSWWVSHGTLSVWHDSLNMCATHPVYRVCVCVCVRLHINKEAIQSLYGVGCSASDAVRCSVLQCVAVCCSVLQCVAVCGSVWQRVAVCWRCVAVFLKCNTVCCSVFQCVAVNFCDWIFWIRGRTCEYKYIYINTYICTYIYTVVFQMMGNHPLTLTQAWFLQIYLGVYLNSSTRISISWFLRSDYQCIHTHIFLKICRSVRICEYILMCVCIYICVYVCTNMQVRKRGGPCEYAYTQISTRAYMYSCI